ncbi:MAG TPA: winged helix-turn-helix transcriptional regulator [Candidatus Binatia bacterium]|nr:winged helix-turn-helix transcriptional regulator [Candidatus Binatia bacterium]
MSIGDPAPLGCRWSLAIVATLLAGPCRTLELRRRVGGIRLKVLSERLRALERAGCVARTEAPGYPRRVWYALTPTGRRLGPVLRPWAAAGVAWELAEMVLKCRWTSEIVLALRAAALRPAEVRARVPGLGKRRLFARLAWLEARGVVERRVVPSRPPVTVHRLTPRGRRLAAGLARAAARDLLALAAGRVAAGRVVVRRPPPASGGARREAASAG